MSQQELLTRVIEVLDRLNAPYFISGSWASSLHGEPRFTHDLDLVVALEAAMVVDLIAAFPPPQFYLSEAAVTEAVHNRSMFNLLDNRCIARVRSSARRSSEVRFTE